MIPPRQLSVRQPALQADSDTRERLFDPRFVELDHLTEEPTNESSASLTDGNLCEEVALSVKGTDED